jgi:trans-aconitate methyltransferase
MAVVRGHDLDGERAGRTAAMTLDHQELELVAEVGDRGSGAGRSAAQVSHRSPRAVLLDIDRVAQELQPRERRIRSLMRGTRTLPPRARASAHRARE